MRAEMLVTVIMCTCHVNSFRKDAHATVKLQGLCIAVSSSGVHKFLPCVDRMTPEQGQYIDLV